VGDLPVRLNLAAIDAFVHGPEVEHELVRRGQRVTQAAKRFAPVSPRGSGGRRSGFLRSSVRLIPGRDGRGPYVDITSPATTARGAPYGLFQEIGTRKMAAQPHLRPALDTEFPGATGVSPGPRGRRAARRGRRR
jgi:hypothetical protein